MIRASFNRARATVGIAAVLGATLTGSVRAQDTLTLDDALRLARAGSYTIRQAENDVAIAANNNTAGAAGMLPRLDLTTGLTGALNNSRQELASGETVTRSGASSSNITSGLGVTWTVFDGFRMGAVRDRFEEQQELAEVNVRTVDEGVAAQVMRSYYDIVQQQNLLNVIRATLDISRQRVENVQIKYEVGENSKRELLQARVDLNTDSSSALRQEVALANAKITLNQLLVRDMGTDFAVRGTIDLATDLQYDILLREAMASNSRLSAARIGQSMARVEERIAEAGWYPRVGLSLGYNLLMADAQTGQVLNNRNHGLTYGVTASMNLFDGFNTRRESENARIESATSDLIYAELENQVEGDLRRAYTNYRNRLQLVELERSNVALARENLDLAFERYRVGTLIPLELREAQTARVAAESRLVSALYDAKLAETELLRLSGRLALPR